MYACYSIDKLKDLLLLPMLLQLENTNPDAISKLLAFAKENKMQLSLVDDETDNYVLPGKPLSQAALQQLINESRMSGTIAMEDAHRNIRKEYHAD